VRRNYARTQRRRWAWFHRGLTGPGYTLFGLQTGMEMPNGVLIYIDARNLTDRRYISDFGTITDARRASTEVFYSGTGRSIYAGMRIAFK
jgi:iron complex outermembrane receptor protein